MKRVKVLILLGVAVAITVGCGNQTANDPLAFVEKVEKGEAFVKKAAATDFTKVDGRLALFEGDTVKTSDSSEALIRFATGAVTRLMPNTQFEMKPLKIAQTDQKIVYTRLVQGIAYFYVEKTKEGAKKFEVETERAIASIKGTIFKLAQDKDKTTLTVSEGKVQFLQKSEGKTLDVEAFQEATIGPDGINGPSKANFMTDSFLTDAPPPSFFNAVGK